ncbi:MFS transporter (plasmid) [Burkholderia sp. SFA1]|uniref:MFS transporter n=1 Tax=unclassified Caballeronia TaxID=2646786 RepID=UPI001F284261|nr:MULTISPECIES: MFS transporter [unclassified Caballeronia]MCE4547055.1 MFS transporter [Caballeronia sp. PC1]MCE4572472.1 MFS transporter [Caballeronia sp. CLC5]BBQ02161.1 MFS transporter [Burkholderia sp. SFA1]
MSSDAIDSRKARRLRCFAAGLMLGIVAEQTVLFAVPLIIYQETASMTYSGIAFAVEWVPALICYPFAGVLADRVGGKRLFLLSNAGRALCLLIAALVCWTVPGATIAALMINSALLSAFMAPIRMSVEKTVPALAEGDTLARLQSLVQNAELLSRALGPVLAAGLAYRLGKLPLLVVAAGAFAAAVLCWRGMPTGLSAKATPSRVGQELLLGWKLLIRNRPVLMLALVNFTINLAFAIAISANAYLITGLFHAPDSVFGLMNTAAGLLGFINLLAMPRLLKMWSVYRIGASGFAVMCIGLASMGWTDTLWVYAMSFPAAMAGVAWFNVFNRTQRARAIEPEHLGKVIGPFYLVNSLSYPIAGLITAGLGPALGVQHIMLFMAGLLSLPGAALLWLTARGFRAKLDDKGPQEHASASAAAPKCAGRA